LLISPKSCHDQGVKILIVLAVLLALTLPALAGHETLFGEASR